MANLLGVQQVVVIFTPSPTPVQQLLAAGVLAAKRGQQAGHDLLGSVGHTGAVQQLRSWKREMERDKLNTCTSASNEQMRFADQQVQQHQQHRPSSPRRAASPPQ